MEVLFDMIAYILSFGISLLILFFVMKAAVKSAVYDINEKVEKDLDELIKLRDIELLTDVELEEVIKIYKDEKAKKENYEEYLKYSVILDELKEREYFSPEEYVERSNKLKEYYHIDEPLS